MDKLSYSMLLDRKIINEPFEDIDNRKIYKWVDDDAVFNCYSCNITFNLLYRRHHCRVCGRIFCYNCSNNFMFIPEDMQIKKKYSLSERSDESYLTKYIKNSKDSKKVRLCNNCCKKIVEINRLKKLIIVFEMIKLDIPDLLKVRYVCKSWRKAANYLLSKIREIQYYLSDHKYNNFDKKNLWINRHHIVGHSQWLIRLLKSIDYENYEYTKNKLNEIISIMEKDEKNASCLDLMCTRECKKYLTAEDCLSLLDKSIKSKIIKEFSIKFLDNAAIDELICYLPFLVHHMKYETIEDSIIGNYLINKCTKFSQLRDNKIESNKLIFINEFYWLINLGLDDGEYSNRYKFFIDKFDFEIYGPIQEIIKSGHNLINILNQLPENLDDGEIRAFLKRKLSKIDNLTIPLNPIMNNIEINISEIHRKKSATKPLFLPLKNHLGNTVENYNILYKNEDLRKDKIILTLIKLINIILKREEKLDLDILTYEVRPINSKSGIIEIISNCETIYHIKEKLKFTILNYIMENNKGERIEVIRNRFMKSCAAYCVITYLLGIGDRHLDNIMITKTGILFHIDYSFILGFDAKMINTNMRITEDMVDALGGINSEYYREFKTLCNRIYNCLRRHINLFIDILTLIPEISPPIDNQIPFTREKIKNEIINRFIPGESHNQAELQLCNYIENSSKDYKYMIADYFHYQNKENTITSTIVSSYDSAKNAIYNAFSSLF